MPINNEVYDECEGCEAQVLEANLRLTEDGAPLCDECYKAAEQDPECHAEGCECPVHQAIDAPTEAK